jgi:hypothetical protein
MRKSTYSEVKFRNQRVNSGTSWTLPAYPGEQGYVIFYAKEAGHQHQREVAQARDELRTEWPMSAIQY